MRFESHKCVSINFPYSHKFVARAVRAADPSGAAFPIFGEGKYLVGNPGTGREG